MAAALDRSGLGGRDRALATDLGYGTLRRLRSIEETLSGAEHSGLTKKELLGLLREQDKLERSLGGIKEMGGLPNMLFVIDTNKEAIAIAEARKLGIPVTAIVDSNSNPDGIATNETTGVARRLAITP